MLGYNKDELEGQHVEILFSIANQFHFNASLYPQIEVYGQIQEAFIHLKGKSEDAHPVLMSASKNNSSNEKHINFVVMPLSKRIRYENEIRTISRQTEESLLTNQAALERLETLLEENEEKTQELIELNERLKQIAYYDTLTGLFNRRKLIESLDDQVKSHKTSTKTFSVVMLDIDHFKNVNDEWGHLVGDQILIFFGKLLMYGFRKTDIITRFGGEEFAVILPETDEETAVDLAESVRMQVMAMPYGECEITVSCGVATFSSDDNQQSILRKADNALFAAKNSGRNKVIHESSLYSNTSDQSRSK